MLLLAVEADSVLLIPFLATHASSVPVLLKPGPAGYRLSSLDPGLFSILAWVKEPSALCWVKALPRAFMH